MASWRGERSIAELCRSSTSARACCAGGASRRSRAGWGASRPASSAPKAPSQRWRIAKLERALGRKSYELEIAGKLWRDWE